MPLVDGISLAQQTVPFHNLISNVLMDLRECRRAIPFCERAIQLVLEREQGEPTAVAELLAREGRCYAQSGLKDHAAIPLRAALKKVQSLRFSHIITRYEEIDYRRVADCHRSSRSKKPQSVRAPERAKRRSEVADAICGKLGGRQDVLPDEREAHRKRKANASNTWFKVASF